MPNHDIAARKCANCHRVFSKAEHLRRHQRSHTGERPFKCKHCGRKYARSDVLNRHVRHHHPASGPDNGAELPPGEAAEILQKRTSPLPNAGYDEPDSGSPAPSSQDPATSPRNTTTSECPDRQGLRVPNPIDDNWADIQFDVLHGMDSSYPDELCGFLEEGCDVQVINERPSRQLAALSDPRQDFDPRDSIVNLSIGLPQAPAHHTAAEIIPPDVDFGSILLDGLLLTPPGSGDQRLSHHPKNNISNEQFEQVRRLWPTRRRTVTLMPSAVCWDDILLHPEDNIFSSTSLKALSSLEPLATVDSTWKFTEACRDRLIQTINNNYARHSEHTTNIVASPSAYGSWDNGLPPTDILDLCLDLYFNKFHVHMPFVHPATLNASETPSLLLFPMCVVGLMILNRDVARKVIANYLPGMIHHCRAELASPGLRHCSGPSLLTALGGACLILFIAASTAEMAFEEQRQALYEEMVSLARERGLFGPPTYNFALIQAVKDIDVTWKAWARIQSAQRLTGCLILADAYSSQMLGTVPILSPDQIQLPLIRGDDLFYVSNSQKWESLIGLDDPWSKPLFMAPEVHNYPQGLTGFGLQTILAVTWLRVLKAQRSIRSPTERVPESWTSHLGLHPGQMDTNNAPSIGSCLPLIFIAYEANLKSGNGNALILWHYLGLRVTTDLSIVEDAAGRNGPEAAKEAVEALKLWANSPAARRACLHAFQALLAVAHHCQSDGVMLHSEIGLFNAALVVGFYLLTAPRFESIDAPCYDLFDDVDWGEVGASGLDVQNFEEHDSSSISAARVFIQRGGPVCFNGSKYHSPYGAARRTFMNFASQLEEFGKWNVQEYCKVLHIISDTLLASDLI